MVNRFETRFLANCLVILAFETGENDTDLRMDISDQRKKGRRSRRGHGPRAYAYDFSLSPVELASLPFFTKRNANLRNPVMRGLRFSCIEDR